MTGPYTLLEEARKSWDYFVSNKVVYFAETRNRNMKGLAQRYKKYAKRGFWVELHWFLGNEGQIHHTFIYEALRASNVRNVHCAGNLPTDVRKPDWNYFMFEGVTELVEKPQEIVFVGRPSVIRLKLSDPAECLVRNPFSNLKESFLAPFSLTPKNREARRIAGSGSSQFPCQVIERKAEAVDPLSSKNSNTRRRRLNLESKDITLVPKVFTAGDMVCIEPIEFVQSFIKSFEVFIRPVGEQIKVIYAEHDSEATSP